ncbi:NAD-dependent epimerase/dehydratase family protein [Curtobacterium sp. MR_MD2014]|uniref:NAD-dependent epimerase/dehydratase family protein n=1 Tax=Curtobacterium sp. MR_MD2014 TaxID=1561023 RepID=UPI00052A63A5|nr:NAD-dependent epimerase/dehydratase family protein [Curtobacterium sp. MR_MD2014]AIV39374.1 NAD-dependent dehydratase [Curtobacterium sp. MR_MD2014]
MTTRPTTTRPIVLVTGGAGFIGCALSRVLAPTSARWIAVDALHPQVHAERRRPDALDPAAELVVADVTDPDAWDALLATVRPDVVVHLAAETGTAQSLDEATRHADVNVCGTTVMLDALGRHGVLPSRIVLASSRAVYGEGDWLDTVSGAVVRPGQRTHEQLEAGAWDHAGATSMPSDARRTVPAPTSVYGATKLAQEHVLGAWCAARGVGLAVLRLQNVYGPGQSLTNPYTGIVSLFSQLARRGDSIPVYEDGAIVRDFVHIEDVAGALAAAVTGGPEVEGTPIDVGSGVATTILDLAQRIAAFHGAPAPRITGAYRDGDVRAASCTVEDAAARLGWAPRWSVDAGVADLQTWIDRCLREDLPALV